MIVVKQGWPVNTGGGNSQWSLPVITVLGNTPNFGKVGDTGKYEIFELFELKYAAIFP